MPEQRPITPQEERMVRSCASFFAAVVGVVGLVIILASGLNVGDIIGGFMVCVWCMHLISLLLRS